MILHFSPFEIFKNLEITVHCTVHSYVKDGAKISNYEWICLKYLYKWYISFGASFRVKQMTLFLTAVSLVMIPLSVTSKLIDWSWSLAALSYLSRSLITLTEIQSGSMCLLEGRVLSWLVVIGGVTGYMEGL